MTLNGTHGPLIVNGRLLALVTRISWSVEQKPTSALSPLQGDHDKGEIVKRAHM
jgi:hypothetical protein